MTMKMTQATDILFGLGAVKELSSKLTERNCKNVFLMTDEGLAKAGVMSKVADMLRDAHIDCTCYHDCQADPTNDSIDAAAVEARCVNPDAIIGLGGGSSMDTAKAVSLVIKNPVSIREKFVKPAVPPDVPLFLIPTTSGTGSEVTTVSVITDSVSGLKTGAMITSAALAIVDPELTLPLPPAITAMTGMDALAHAAEALTGSMKNPLSDIRALDALRRISAYLPIAVKDGSNIEARYNMSLASTFAGLAFTDSIVSLGHSIAQNFGAVYHVQHGLACALATPPVMEAFAPYVPDWVREVGSALGVDIPVDASAAQVGKLTADFIRNFMRGIGIQSYRQLGFSRDDILSKVDLIMAEGMIHLSPMPVTPEIIEATLASMYDDYL